MEFVNEEEDRKADEGAVATMRHRIGEHNIRALQGSKKKPSKKA